MTLRRFPVPVRGIVLFGLLGLLAPSTARAAEPLLAETFDDAGALERWQVVDGARTGDGPVSEASVKDGALELKGDASTRRWVALTKTVPTGGAKWVRISARIRTEGVAAGQGFHPNCNLYFRFGRGPIVASRVLLGDNGWTSVARRVPVPKEDGGDLTVGCILSMPGRAFFDEVRVEAVDPPAWEEARTEHYVFRWLPGDGGKGGGVPEEARRRNEAQYKKAGELLGVTRDAPVIFYKYPDLDRKEEYMGLRGNAHAVGDEIHTIWSVDAHEIVHVLARPLGDPPALLGEGLAVHHSGAWQRKPLAEAARAVHAAGKWVPAGDILDSRAFRAQPDEVTYPLSAAFVGWVIETRGREAFFRLYAAHKNGATAAENRRVLEKELGLTLEEADGKLRESLKIPAR